jgi:hypothetical protein
VALVRVQAGAAPLSLEVAPKVRVAVVASMWPGSVASAGVTWHSAQASGASTPWEAAT